ncbi:MAG: methylated-DNA--[protein]-cysteine S-methyltransferase [Mycobacterium leprae]
MSNTVFCTQVQLPPLGSIDVGYTDRGICYLAIAQTEEAFRRQVQDQFGVSPVVDRSRQAQYQDLLDRWFAGNPVEPDLDLSHLSAFDQKVAAICQAIPRGAVRPYQWLAREAGKPGASRAVGGTMARNPVPLLVPCHRVVAASGQIGNYSMGGPAVKRLLLEHEGVDLVRLETLARKGYRFKGSKNTGIFCYPTCRGIEPENEVLFHNAEEAVAAGFRPCKVCRPL